MKRSEMIEQIELTLSDYLREKMKKILFITTLLLITSCGKKTKECNVVTGLVGNVTFLPICVTQFSSKEDRLRSELNELKREFAEETINNGDKIYELEEDIEELEEKLEEVEKKNKGKNKGKGKKK